MLCTAARTLTLSFTLVLICAGCRVAGVCLDPKACSAEESAGDNSAPGVTTLGVNGAGSPKCSAAVHAVGTWKTRSNDVSLVFTKDCKFRVEGCGVSADYVGAGDVAQGQAIDLMNVQSAVATPVVPARSPDCPQPLRAGSTQQCWVQWGELTVNSANQRQMASISFHCGSFGDWRDMPAAASASPAVTGTVTTPAN